jgi:hypothetical protein
MAQRKNTSGTIWALRGFHLRVVVAEEERAEATLTDILEQLVAVNARLDRLESRRES